MSAAFVSEQFICDKCIKKKKKKIEAENARSNIRDVIVM